MTYVVDASVAVEYLLRTPLGRQAATLLDGAMLIAPELLDVEVVSVRHRAVRNGHLEAQRATIALTDLMNWPVNRIRHGHLVMEAWAHHENVSAYDAFYVATARRHNATLITADSRLGWVFRRKPTTDSGGNRPLIPEETDHRFRRKLSTPESL